MPQQKRTLDQQIEALETSQKQNAARLARLKARKAQSDRKLDTRRKILIGAVIFKKSLSDPNLAKQLIQWLDEGLTAKRDRDLFPGLPDIQPKDNG